MKINWFTQIFWPPLGWTGYLPYENFFEKFLGHPGVPREPPDNGQNPYIQGGLLAPLGDPKYFFHMAILNELVNLYHKSYFYIST